MDSMDKYRDMSMVDVAFELMSKKKSAVNFFKLWEEVCQMKKFDEQQQADKESLFYTNITLDGRFIPDCGSMAKMIEASTGRFPEFFGKPSKHTLDYIIRQTGYSPEEIAIVGDRLYTDIAVADKSPVISILVLSGESTMEDVEKSDVKPDMIADSLENITEIL